MFITDTGKYIGFCGLNYQLAQAARLSTEVRQRYPADPDVNRDPDPHFRHRPAGCLGAQRLL